ncbi:MAG: hypothetical protein KAW16_05810 [candidate division Zixibacteria bacterium]|nr:hypothetical protein [candidate division Zixibacteria bacterium]MCK4427979.1 hypothetical protein [candidate division Zixibacteria bacterium]
MQIDRQSIHNIIEYIKHCGFEFDCHDVKENTQRILDYFGIINNFNQQEYRLLKKELLKLAEQYQTREILQLIENSPDPLLKAIKYSKPFSLRLEKIFRKLFIQSLKRKQTGGEQKWIKPTKKNKYLNKASPKGQR